VTRFLIAAAALAAAAAIYLTAERGRALGASELDRDPVDKSVEEAVDLVTPVPTPDGPSRAALVEGEPLSVALATDNVSTHQELPSELKDLMTPLHRERLEQWLSIAANDAYLRAERLSACKNVLIGSIAIQMELAGTGLPHATPGANTRLPAPLRFMRNNRQYCFEDGEYPVYERYMRLRSPNGSDGTDALPDEFLDSIEVLGRDAVAAIDTTIGEAKR
jgi:hypothetical protein